ncbi:hypothetical protein NN3_35930 [Nocardia neocaledoniensis NBRC 108232]|uniref:PE-PGRS family protein n=1 Tax=Nocardia neocaledoniensis TaxID=236511 RepID=A0A317NBX2_9NOCA|nr:hypothetical protein [Nocardia neocaledoniensis]PWV72741.1 hypothetical protein DFR69_10850 [Nocardia neocaledoniensis]GEM32586.1 hypothetical protein NN3_35930 [Nocardia neocaledoniensis NBRC 108232]
MSKAPVELNQRQIDVLGWVRKGCPDGVFTDFQHRVVARALERRGLVVISGKGASWTVTMTEAGQQWNLPASAGRGSADADADQLIAQVLAADGELTMELAHEAKEGYRRLVDRSLRSSARPRGKKLELKPIGRYGSNEYAIVFTEHFDDLVEPRPVPVPEHVAKYHPAVRAFLDDKDWKHVSSEHVLRAARILQAIATEAAHRGIRVQTPAEVHGDGGGRTQRRVKGRLVLGTSHGAYGVDIKEIPLAGTPKVSPVPYSKRGSVPGWIATRSREFVSTGKLELTVHGPGSTYNGDHYRDAKSIKVEDKLPQLFRSLEIYALRADWNRRELERAAAERRVRWESAMSAATERYAENARWEHFTKRSSEWRLVNQHRDFLAAARKHAELYEGELRSDIMRQLDEAEERIDRLDPVRNLSRIVPHVPDPRPEDLKPFLSGWSPHGPSGSAW